MVVATINLNPAAGANLTDEDYAKNIFLNPTPYQQARIANVKNQPFINPLKKKLPKSNILNAVSAVLLEPTTILKSGISDAAQKVEKRREAIAMGDQKEFRKVVGEAITATGYATLATLAAANPPVALGFLRALGPKTALGAVEATFIGTTAAGALAASPTLRKFVAEKIENPFYYPGEFIGEAAEYLSAGVSNKAAALKENASKIGAGVAGVGAGILGTLGAQKIINYFSNKDVPTLPSISPALSSVAAGAASVPTSATVEGPKSTPVVSQPSTNTTETGAAMSPVAPVSVKVSNKINIDNRSSANRRQTKNYIRRQIIRK